MPSMVPFRIQIPDHHIRLRSPGSRRTTFTKLRVQGKYCLESEDRKTKLELRARRRAEAGSHFQKEADKSDGMVEVGDLLLGKLAAQENTVQGLFGDAHKNNEMSGHKDRQKHLERMKRETVEAIMTTRHLVVQTDQSCEPADFIAYSNKNECCIH